MAYGEKYTSSNPIIPTLKEDIFLGVFFFLGWHCAFAQQKGQWRTAKNKQVQNPLIPTLKDDIIQGVFFFLGGIVLWRSKKDNGVRRKINKFKILSSRL